MAWQARDSRPGTAVHALPERRAALFFAHAPLWREGTTQAFSEQQATDDPTGGSSRKPLRHFEQGLVRPLAGRIPQADGDRNGGCARRHRS
jgi:hypothetical protein